MTSKAHSLEPLSPMSKLSASNSSLASPSSPMVTPSHSPTQEFCYRTAEDANMVVMEYIKEKKMLKNTLLEKNEEIQKYKAKMYDLNRKVDDLKAEVSKLNAALKEKQKTTEHAQNEINTKSPIASIVMMRRLAIRAHSNLASKTSTPKSTPSTPKSSRRIRNQTSKSKLSVKPVGSPSTPRQTRKVKQLSPSETAQNGKPPFSRQSSRNSVLESDGNIAIDEEQLELKNRLDYLEELAKKFPDLKLSVLFEAEKLFHTTDMNRDGAIDEHELEAYLTSNGELCTVKDVREIIKQIDLDGSGTVDFIEYLTMMERLQARKQVNLPPQLTKSIVCSIQ